MDDIDYVENLAETYKDMRKTVIESRASSRARLVWNVGIAGFALLNAKPYWDAIAGSAITGVNIAWLSLPWILSAFLGVIAYFLVDESAKKEETFFSLIIADLIFFKFEIDEKGVNAEEFKKINKGEKPPTNAAKRKAATWRKWSKWFEFLTFACLVLGFIWAAIGPLMLK